ncbi:MAG: hypothetical protein ACR2GW_08435 [Pyrinomonadaceae bacterium]
MMATWTNRKRIPGNATASVRSLCANGALGMGAAFSVHGLGSLANYLGGNSMSVGQQGITECPCLTVTDRRRHSLVL